MFLAGDIGGTKVNLALCEVGAKGVKARELRRYSSPDFDCLRDVLKTYFDEVGSPGRKLEGACFGVPGPVVEGRVRTVNLPWALDETTVARAVRSRVPCRAVKLINDLEATAHGLRGLKVNGGLAVLRPSGRREGMKGNQALIAPGTGLGEAVLVWDGRRHLVSASEGGHADFGPQDEEQIELLRWLWSRHKHVSWEHVASGPAIHRMYRFLVETGREKEPPALARRLREEGADPSAIISEAALAGTVPLCMRAVDLWLFCVGAEAGNLALKCLSNGGVFIGGGIVAKITELFRRPAFFKGLNSKGRMTSFVETAGVYAVLDPLTALYGAALAAHNDGAA